MTLSSSLSGKNSEKGGSSKRPSKSAGSRKARCLISDDRSEDAINSTKAKMQLSVKLTPLSTAVLNKRNSNSRTGTTKEKRGTGHGDLTMYQQAYKYSLRSTKQLQDKHLPGESLSEDEEEESSEDIPLSIKRKNKHLCQKETQNCQSSSNCGSSRDDAHKVWSEQRTVKHRSGSCTVPLRHSVPRPTHGSEALEGETPGESSTSRLPEKAMMTRSRLNHLRLLESDTESETNEEEPQMKQKNSKVSDKNLICHISKNAKSSAAKARAPERKKVQKSLELFPRATGGWSEKELQKLYRQVVAPSPQGKGSFGRGEA